MSGEFDDSRGGGLSPAGPRHFVTGDDLAVEGEHGAEKCRWPREVDADDAVRRAVDIEQDPSLPGREPSRRPCSITKPSAISSAIRSLIVTQVSPVSRRVPRDSGAAVEERLQNERAVVSASVLRENLLAGPEGTTRAPMPGGTS